MLGRLNIWGNILVLYISQKDMLCSDVCYLSKIAPTPALWALFLCTCRPVASRIPSFTEMERWEKDAISSSFQPVGEGVFYCEFSQLGCFAFLCT